VYFSKEVQEGLHITITNRGKPIAQLVPIVDVDEESAEEIDRSAELLRASLGPMSIRKLIADGRKC